MEPDASSASYFLAAGAIAGGTVVVKGLGRESLQGEARFASVLERMGARVEMRADSISVSKGDLRGVDADMDEMSDTGMTLAMAALFAKGPTTIRNIGNWRVKETDRIAAMAAELRKVGATVEEGPDWLGIHPPAALRSAAIDTYQDHRMAMCFSLVSLGGVPVTIRDPGCTRKTYPGYFDAFRSLAGRQAMKTPSPGTRRHEAIPFRPVIAALPEIRGRSGASADRTAPPGSAGVPAATAPASAPLCRPTAPRPPSSWSGSSRTPTRRRRCAAAWG